MRLASRAPDRRESASDTVRRSRRGRTRTGSPPGSPHHPVERQVAQRVHPEVAADLVDRVAGRDQLGLGRRVDAVVARPRDRRRRDAEVDLGGAGGPDHLHQSLAGGAAHQRIVHHHHALALQHVAHGVELDLHLGVAARLRRVDERAPDVVVSDQAMLELDPGFLGEPEGHRVRGVGHGEDAVGAGRGMLARQLAAQGAPHAVHGAAEDGAVGPREVHQLEDAAPVRLGGERRQTVDLGPR